MNLRVCLRHSPSAVAAITAVALTGCFNPPPPPPGYGRPYGPPPQPDFRPDHYRPDFVGPPRPETPQQQPQNPERNYPVATRTNNPDQVISPYKPYNVIDVAGFRSGQLAKDPSNNQIFRVP